MSRLSRTLRYATCSLIHPLRLLVCSSPLRQRCSRLNHGVLGASYGRPFSTERQWRQAEVNEIRLRPYQEECIQAILDYLAKGERRLGISLATGSGKTVIFSHLIERISPPTSDATLTLILAHRQELIEQAAGHCRNLYPDKVVDVEMGKQHASGSADITVASVQSLVSGGRMLKFDPRRFKLLLVDEAHHVAAQSYLDIVRHFGLLDAQQETPTALVGVSATLDRNDGLSLGKAIDHIVYHKDYIDMIEGDWLANLIFTTVQSGANLAKVKTVRGDFQTGQLSKAVDTDESNAITVRAWLAKAGNRKSTLVFCIDLSHVANLTATFRQHGVDARFITGDTQLKERKERLDAFRRGEYSVLLNCGIFTEGTDIPNIDCVLLARPTKSRNLLVQMIGRGLRKHPGKENCHVIDMVASLATGIVTTPTLFGLDPQELVDNVDAKKMRDLKERKDNERVRQDQASSTLGNTIGNVGELTGNITFTDYEDVNDLIEDSSGERHVRAISPHAWVQVDEDRYILSSSTGHFLQIMKVDQRYRVWFTQKLPPDARGKSPYMKPRLIAGVDTFEHGLRAADRLAKEKMPFEFISKNARWRGGPASDGQLVYLNKFRDEGEKLEAHKVTKGKAGDWITKIKHGARGRFNKIVSEKKKAGKVQEKRTMFQAMQNRAQVRVGPVARF